MKIFNYIQWNMDKGKYEEKRAAYTGSCGNGYMLRQNHWPRIKSWLTCMTICKLFSPSVYKIPLGDAIKARFSVTNCFSFWTGSPGGMHKQTQRAHFRRNILQSNCAFFICHSFFGRHSKVRRRTMFIKQTKNIYAYNINEINIKIPNVHQ